MLPKQPFREHDPCVMLKKPEFRTRRVQHVKANIQAADAAARQTAASYLDTLADSGFVEKHRAGKNNYYVNTSLVRLLMTVSEGA